MITEDYVSFEIAKLLKEKGFDEITFTWYNGKGKFCVGKNNYDDYHMNHFSNIIMEKDKNKCSAPTQQMTMKWLREVHNIFIVIEPHMYDYINEKNSSYVASLWQGDNYYENIISKDCPTYEETVEAAIKYCLENLI